MKTIRFGNLIGIRLRTLIRILIVTLFKHLLGILAGTLLGTVLETQFGILAGTLIRTLIRALFGNRRSTGSYTCPSGLSKPLLAHVQARALVGI